MDWHPIWRTLVKGKGVVMERDQFEERLLAALETIATAVEVTHTGEYAEVTLNDIGKEIVQQMVDINNGLNRIVNGLEELKIDEIRFTK